MSLPSSPSPVASAPTCADCSGPLVGPYFAHTPDCPRNPGLTTHAPVASAPTPDTTAPERIYLQLCDEDDCTLSYAEHDKVRGEDMTWCRDSVLAHEIEYVRADLARPVASASAPGDGTLDTALTEIRRQIARFDGAPSENGRVDVGLPLWGWRDLLARCAALRAERERGAPIYAVQWVGDRRPGLRPVPRSEWFATPEAAERWRQANDEPEYTEVIVLGYRAPTGSETRGDG